MACAIPRPCTNSDIWSQRRDGSVLPHELLAAQGFAAWLFKSIRIQLVSNSDFTLEIKKLYLLSGVPVCKVLLLDYGLEKS